jgi:hypothetical protein
VLKRCLDQPVAIAGLDDDARRGLRWLAGRGLLDERDGHFTITASLWREFVARGG